MENDEMKNIFAIPLSENYEIDEVKYRYLTITKLGMKSEICDILYNKKCIIALFQLLRYSVNNLLSIDGINEVKVKNILESIEHYFHVEGKFFKSDSLYKEERNVQLRNACFEKSLINNEDSFQKIYNLLQTSFLEIYKINSEKYRKINLNYIGIDNSICKKLSKKGCRTLAQLMNYSISKLFHISSISRENVINIINLIEAFLKTEVGEITNFIKLLEDSKTFITLQEVYDINSRKYSYIYLSQIGISSEISNSLFQKNCTTLSQLLNCSVAWLCSFYSKENVEEIIYRVEQYMNKITREVSSPKGTDAAESSIKNKETKLEKANITSKSEICYAEKNQLDGKKYNKKITPYYIRYNLKPSNYESMDVREIIPTNFSALRILGIPNVAKLLKYSEKDLIQKCDFTRKDFDMIERNLEKLSGTKIKVQEPNNKSEQAVQKAEKTVPVETVALVETAKIEYEGSKNEEVCYAEKYGLNANEYDNLALKYINYINFSKGLCMRLNNNNIFSIGDLLRQTSESLKNMGLNIKPIENTLLFLQNEQTMPFYVRYKLNPAYYKKLNIKDFLPKSCSSIWSLGITKVGSLLQYNRAELKEKYHMTKFDIDVIEGKIKTLSRENKLGNKKENLLKNEEVKPLELTRISKKNSITEKSEKLEKENSVRTDEKQILKVTTILSEVAMRDKFFTWLSGKVKPEQLSELYIVYKDIEKFCLSKKILKDKLFETTDFTVLHSVRDVVEKNRIARFNCSHNHSSVTSAISAINYYIDFLQNQLDQLSLTSSEIIKNNSLELEVSAVDLQDKLELSYAEKYRLDSESYNNILLTDIFNYLLCKKLKEYNLLTLKDLLNSSKNILSLELTDAELERIERKLLSFCDVKTTPFFVRYGLNLSAYGQMSVKDLLSKSSLSTNLVLKIFGATKVVTFLEYTEKELTENLGLGENTIDNIKNILKELKNRDCNLQSVKPEKINFSNKFSLQPQLYNDVTIESINFSIRVSSRLQANKIMTVEDLLNSTEDDLLRIKGFGENSIKEVEEYLESLTKDGAGKIKFSDKFSLKPQFYNDVTIESINFPIRVSNRLQANKIVTVEDLLNSTEEDLLRVKGFGKNSVEEVEKYLESLTKDSMIELASVPNKTRGIPKNIYIHRNDIINGFFSFEYTKNEEKYITEYIEAYNTLDEALVKECYYNPLKVMKLVNMCNSYIQKQNQYIEILNCFDCIPQRRKENRASGYIKAYTNNEEKRQKLLSFCSSEDTTLIQMMKSIRMTDAYDQSTIIRFFRWCQFDLYAEINTFFESIYSKERNKIVLQGRADGKTLEQIGHILSITRERVRQIGCKISREFGIYQKRIKIISKVSAERNNDSVLTIEEITPFCGLYANELIYLLKGYKSLKYTFDKGLDVFIVDDMFLADKVLEYVDRLPNIIKENELSNILREAYIMEDIPDELLTKAILKSYKRTGNVYHRDSLTLSYIYKKTLETFYAEGIHVYDAKSIQEFRESVYKLFGSVNLPENDRSITARIVDSGILCDRGKYRPKKNQYIPSELAARIFNFIKNNEVEILMMKIVFTKFEKELRKYNIDNHYYLQGILHEMYADQLYFKRDYVSTNSNLTSIYSTIVNYIENANYLVTKEQIKNQYPGITDSVITFATNHDNILNYFGEYLHVNKIKISQEETVYLKNKINEVVYDGLTHHIKGLYDTVKQERPEIFMRNAVHYPHSAFSLLEYLFRDDFQFERPFFAKNSVEINRSAERLETFIAGKETVDVLEVRQLADEMRYVITSMIEYINSYNDTHLWVNKDKIMKIDAIGITEEIVHNVEEKIIKCVDDTVPIRNIMYSYNLPQINVPWTDWLVYAALNKWGTKTDVALSNAQLRYAVPLIAAEGKMNITQYDKIQFEESSSGLKIDDLDNLDDLIGDLIEVDITEDDYEF